MSRYTIIERRFPLEHYLVRKIFGTMSIGKYSKAYGQVVYFDEQNPQVITAKLVYLHNSEEESQSFVRFIEQDLCFNECLIVSTLYFNKPIPLIKKILENPIKPVEDFLAHIFKQTNGYLIYSFQFEQLAQLTLNIPLDEAVRLRRLFNKQPDFLNCTNSDDEPMSIFKSILKKRNIGNVYTPNYPGALNLLRYATSFA
jgi:hypothetical protein